MTARCRADTSRGYRCLNVAGPSGYCPGHDPSRVCGAPTVSGRPCRRPRELGLRTCTKHTA